MVNTMLESCSGSALTILWPWLSGFPSLGLNFSHLWNEKVELDDIEGLVFPGVVISPPSHLQISPQQGVSMNTSVQGNPLSRLLTRSNWEKVKQLLKVQLLLTCWDILAPWISWDCCENWVWQRVAKMLHTLDRHYLLLCYHSSSEARWKSNLTGL